jgi:hypothetical protein
MAAVLGSRIARQPLGGVGESGAALCTTNAREKPLAEDNIVWKPLQLSG